jgi:hypothetical protein
MSALYLIHDNEFDKRSRQANAFRARILEEHETRLAMDAEKKKVIENMAVRLYLKDVEIVAKDKRIAELEEHIAGLNSKLENLGFDMVTMQPRKYPKGD